MTRTTSLLSVLLLATLAFASSPTPGPVPSPDHLLPEAPTAVVTVRSVNDLHALWAEFAAVTGEDSGAEDLHAALAEGIPGFAEMTDLGLPLAMTVRVLPFMMQQEPLMTMFLPLQPSITDVTGYVDMDDVKVVLIQDGYVALSADPDYAPAAETPALARGMLDGVVSASFDFGGLIEDNRAMIDMSLASAPMAMAMVDTAGEQEMTPEQMAAMVDVARLVLDSLDRVDAAVDLVGDDLVLRSHGSMHPGSPLDCGDQPDFAEALALTRLLPPDGMIVQASAMNLDKLFDLFGGFYAQSMQDALPDLTPGKQPEFQTLWDDYLSLVSSKLSVMASSMQLRDGMMSGATVVKVAGAKDLLDEFARLADAFNALDLGFTYDRLPDGEAGGLPVYGWTMDLDAMIVQSLAEQGGDEDMDADEIGKILDVLDSLPSTTRFCARDDVLMIAFDDDPEGIAALVRTAERGNGRLDARAASLAVRAGPDCREVIYGDYSVVMDWILGIMPQAHGMRAGPMEFEGFWTLDGPDSGMELVVDMDGVGAFIRLIDEMEGEAGANEHGHDHPE